jgi:hypothetical protein
MTRLGVQRQFENPLKTKDLLIYKAPANHVHCLPVQSLKRLPRKVGKVCRIALIKFAVLVTRNLLKQRGRTIEMRLANWFADIIKGV